MDKIFGLAPEQFLIVAPLVMLVILIVTFIVFIIFLKKRNNESSEYVHEAGNNETTDKDDDDDDGFYNFKVTIFDSTGNIIKEEVIKCQDYEYDSDSYVFYFLDENEKDHYIYVEGNFIVHVDEL